MAELEGQLAVVARSRGLLAEAMALALAAAGARLAVVDEDPGAAEALAARIRTNGQAATAYSYALTESGVRSTLDAISAAAGSPDILVTCPAQPVVRPSTELALADFRRAMDDNLVHAYLWSQAVGRRMLEAGKGVIVHVTGLSGMGGWPGWLADGAALAGVHNLTHTLATEWTRCGVRVNCLVPGVTEELLPYLLQTPAAPDRETVLRRIPAGRLAEAGDLGKALIYLVRPAASFISGEILRVDGAWDVWGRYYAVDPSARR